MSQLTEWTLDFWKVNSYSYPHNFSPENEKAAEAWVTFLSFFDFERYDELKEYWDSREDRRLRPSATESWKATFEELGLLYVITGSNSITITPAGQQIREYGESHNLEAFVWTGLNLLVRYPLRGPRQGRRGEHRTSDLYIYKFLFSALLDLDNYIWKSELERVIYHVFNTGDAKAAIEDIKQTRENPALINELSYPEDTRGAFYNSLNQVLNHASMNHLVLGRSHQESPYSDALGGLMDQRIFIRPQFEETIKKLLTQHDSVDPAWLFVDILQPYNHYQNERDYFEALGRAVDDNAPASSSQYVDQFEDTPPVENAAPKARDIKTTVYERDPRVRKAALKRADGYCERCGAKGFETSTGAIYLESHHIIPLSEDGPDHISNVIALCPNHHREAHYGKDFIALRETMLAIIEEKNTPT